MPECLYLVSRTRRHVFFVNLTGNEQQAFLKGRVVLQKACHSDIKVDDNIYIDLNIN